MADVSFRAAGAYLVPGWGRTAVPVSPSSSISRGRPAFWKVVQAAESQRTSPHSTKPSFQFFQLQPGGSGFLWSTSKGRRVPPPCGLAPVWVLRRPPLRHWHDTVRTGLPGTCLAGCRLDILKGKCEHIFYLKPPVP